MALTEPISADAPADAPAAVLPRSPAASRVALPLALASVVAVLAYWGVDSAAPAIPAMRDDLALSGAGAGLIFSLFFAGRLVGNFPAAFLVDRVGPARTGAVGGLALIAGGLLAAVAGSSVPVLVARALEGAGIALLITAALLSILRARPGDGAAMTLFTLLTTIGGVFGLTSGGLLTESISWRAVFVLHGGLGAAALAITLGAWLRGRAPSLAPHLTHQDAVVPPGARGALITGTVANFLVFVNYAVFVVALPLYADHRFEASAERISTLLLTITGTHLVAAFPAGAMIRRHGSARVLIAGNILAAAGLLLVLAAPSLWLLMIPLVVYGVGQVAASSAAGDFILQRGGRSGRAVGLVRLSSDIGLVLGPLAIGKVADLLGYSAPFLVLPVVTAACALFVAARLLGRHARAA